MRTLSDMDDTRPLRVALALTDGVPVFDAAIPCEVFGKARDSFIEPWYDFVVCAPGGAGVGDWFRTETAHRLDELARADLVIVPARHDPRPAVEPELVAALRDAHAAGATIASICTGAFALAAAGLLDGREAATHWMYADLLAARHPELTVRPDVLFIDDGDVLTSAGTTAGIDLCLHLVRRHRGAAVANALARRLVAPPHRSGGQAQYIEAPVPEAGADALSDLLAWADERLDTRITVADLAARAHVSTRHLTRRFQAELGTTPLRWLLARRVQRAQELLERTELGVDRIADLTGMGSAATLRRHFGRALGVPPDAYRRTFRARERAAA